MASPQQANPISVVESLGLLDDAPRDVVKGIVIAAQAAGPSDPTAVERALTAFNLTTLLKPGATAATLAAGIADLVRSGVWAQVLETSK